MQGVLKGVKVVDFTRVLAGPYCGMMLADMGADVIKIERPDKGDDSRQLPPFVNGESLYYINLNRNKRGITLDLKKDKAKEIVFELVKKADILIENFRPGVMERLGLGYDVLKQTNPKLVYGCVSGFGHYGPYHDRAGYDIIGQAIGGLMSTTGWPEDEPTRTGTAIADVLGGLNLSIGVLAAYYKAKETGCGQKVDVALVDCVVSSLEIISQIYIATGEVPKRIGNRYEAIYPYDSFKVKDGNIVIACGNDKLFAIFANVMEKPELLQNPLFKHNKDRVENHSVLKSIIEDWLKDMTMDEAVEKVLSSGVPASQIYTIDRMVKDEHIANARKMFVDIMQPEVGPVTLTGNQIKFSGDCINEFKPAPKLGQHNDEVLSEWLNMSGRQIQDLQANKII